MHLSVWVLINAGPLSALPPAVISSSLHGALRSFRCAGGGETHAQQKFKYHPPPAPPRPVQLDGTDCGCGCGFGTVPVYVQRASAAALRHTPGVRQSSAHKHRNLPAFNCAQSPIMLPAHLYRYLSVRVCVCKYILLTSPQTCFSDTNKCMRVRSL